MRRRWDRWIRVCHAAAAIVLAANISHAQRGGSSASAEASARLTLQDRPRIGGKPNLNGIWQALNTAYWNLEDHSAEGLKDIWQLGAIGAIPAGQSVVRGGAIPYKPEALAKR